ncbi:MAG: hypothetical protein ACRCZY_03785, partial [Phocaeicola sp.]
LVIPQERTKVDVSTPDDHLFSKNTVNSYIKMVYSLQNTTTSDWIVGEGPEAENQRVAYIPVDVAFNMNQVVNYVINFGTGNGGYDDGGKPIIDSEKMIQFDTNFTDWADETPIDPTPTPTPTPPTPTSNIPDKLFAQYLLEQKMIKEDPVGSGNYVALNDEETGEPFEYFQIDALSKPTIYSGITSVVGIELFPEIAMFNMMGTNVTSIDLSKNSKLLGISVAFTPLLESIKATDMEGVESFSILRVAKLCSLDLSGSTVKLISIDDAPLLDLNIILPDTTSLTSFNYDKSGLTSFDFDALPSTLECLSCHSNRLSRLDVTRFKGLKHLTCGAQVSSTGEAYLGLTLTAAQRVEWEDPVNGWGKDDMNKRVNLITVP